MGSFEDLDLDDSANVANGFILSLEQVAEPALVIPLLHYAAGITLLGARGRAGSGQCSEAILPQGIQGAVSNLSIVWEAFISPERLLS